MVMRPRVTSREEKYKDVIINEKAPPWLLIRVLLQVLELIMFILIERYHCLKKLLYVTCYVGRKTIKTILSQMILTEHILKLWIINAPKEFLKNQKQMN